MKRTVRVWSAAAAVGACVFAGATWAGGNLLDDGTFDNAISGTQTSNSAWTLNVNFPDGSGPAAQFQTGFGNSENTSAGGDQPSGIGNGVWFRSFEGNQSGGGDPLAQAELTQSIIAPTSGDYTLTFRASRESNFTAREFFVSLSSDGTGGSTSVDLLTAAIYEGAIGGTGSSGGTEVMLQLFGVTAGDELTVAAVMIDGIDALQNPQSAFVDRFVLVPAPGAFALLGLAGLTVPGSRRRRK